MDQNSEINRTLGKILGVMEGISKQLEEGNKRMDKHDEEISELKTFKDNAIGRISVISSTAGFVFAIVGSFLSRKLGF